MREASGENMTANSRLQATPTGALEPGRYAPEQSGLDISYMV